VGSGSRRSSSNKPAGLSPQAGDRLPPSRACRGDEMAGIRLDQCLGYLDLWWRAPQQSSLPPLAGRDGRRWRKFLLLPFLYAVVSPVFISLLPGRGGEGLGVRSRDAVEGCNPRLLPSGGSGVVEWPGKLATAWCCGRPCSDLKVSPPNKLKTVILDCRSDELSRQVICGTGRRQGLRSTGSSRVLLLLLAGLDSEGEEEDCPVLLPCWRWTSAFFELIVAYAFFAFVILCRQGGNCSTSMLEALARHCRGCSNSPRGEVIRSPLRREGLIRLKRIHNF
jgi:hypothetical protein